jgi:hypothetical protein
MVQVEAAAMAGRARVKKAMMAANMHFMMFLLVGLVLVVVV